MLVIYCNKGTQCFLSFSVTCGGWGVLGCCWCLPAHSHMLTFTYHCAQDILFVLSFSPHSPFAHTFTCTQADLFFHLTIHLSSPAHLWTAILFSCFSTCLHIHLLTLSPVPNLLYFSTLPADTSTCYVHFCQLTCAQWYLPVLSH